MSCNSCGTGSDGLPKGCRNNGACGHGGCNTKLAVFDWLSNMHDAPGVENFPIVEVQFKNSRKEFFKKEGDIHLYKGDIVAVEASSGHDVGVVSMTGDLVRLQMKKRGVKIDAPEIKKIFRKARQADIDKWQAARELEVTTMYKARTIAVKLGLQMKISDVEYQGDKSKAIFYYTADERVDFRELIKVLADEFRVRIEMKQIGARQEASRLGGIGSCGRELCCSTWLTDFRSVSTSAARYQQLSLNPLKLAGQCGKLKCCLNYELDSYMDALKGMPDSGITLRTKAGKAYHQKTDIFKRLFWYTYEDKPTEFIALKADRVREIIDMNRREEFPEMLENEKIIIAPKKKEDMFYENVVGQDSLTRFDKKQNRNRKPMQRSRNPEERTRNTTPRIQQPKTDMEKGGVRRPNQNQNQNQNLNPSSSSNSNPSSNTNSNPNRNRNHNRSRKNKPNPPPGAS
ncbi:MAG: stage 0 sporulation family protein [Bacteroidota bacterium]|jgi:cell fate regulator YaaT (PSP1 superfamily)